MAQIIRQGRIVDSDTRCCRIDLDGAYVCSDKGDYPHIRPVRLGCPLWRTATDRRSPCFAIPMKRWHTLLQFVLQALDRRTIPERIENEGLIEFTPCRRVSRRKYKPHERLVVTDRTRGDASDADLLTVTCPVNAEHMGNEIAPRSLVDADRFAVHTHPRHQ